MEISMHPAAFLGAIAAAYLPYIITPGPNFVLLTRISSIQSRRHGVLAAMGVSSASVLMALLAMFGLGALLTQVHGLAALLAIVGGGYLIFTGIRSAWRTTSQTTNASEANPGMSHAHPFVAGFLNNMSNPQSIIFFSSVFSALIIGDLPLKLEVAGVAVIAALSFGNNLGTAVLFSHSHIQQACLRRKPQIERITGLILALYGVAIAHKSLLAAHIL
jgi:threonine/homoserine/homoserine lactone efflux protein